MVWNSEVHHKSCYTSANDLLLLFSCQVVSDSSRPQRLQHARLLCPSSSPRVCSSSCLLNSRWYYPTISFSVTLFSFCRHSFPASFAVNWLLVSGGQSIGASALVLPMNIQDWFPLGLTGLIFLQPKELSRVFSSTIWKHHFFGTKPFYGPTLTSIHD